MTSKKNILQVQTRQQGHVGNCPFLRFLAKTLLLLSQQLPLFLLMQLPLSLLHSADRAPGSKGINGKAGCGADLWKSSSNRTIDKLVQYLKNIQCQETKIHSVSSAQPSWWNRELAKVRKEHPLPPGTPTSRKNTPSPPINVELGPLLLGQRKAKLPAMLCSIQHQSILALSNWLPVKVFFFEDRHTPGNATILRKPCFEPNCVWGHSTLSVRRLLEGADPRTPKGQNSQTAGKCQRFHHSIHALLIKILVNWKLLKILR